MPRSRLSLNRWIVQNGGRFGPRFHRLALRRARHNGSVDTTENSWWDEQAGTFDDEADHGLRDPAVRQAWATLLMPLLPAAPARVADLHFMVFEDLSRFIRALITGIERRPSTT